MPTQTTRYSGPGGMLHKTKQCCMSFSLHSISTCLQTHGDQCSRLILYWKILSKQNYQALCRTLVHKIQYDNMVNVISN